MSRRFEANCFIHCIKFQKSDREVLAVIHSEFTPTTLATVASDKTPGMMTIKREESPTDVSDRGSIILRYEDPTVGTGIRMVSDHLEVDTVVREALNHMLLGSRPRGVRISEGFVGKALTKVAPAIFDTDRLRVVLPPSPLLRRMLR